MPALATRQAGFTLIEALITMFVIAIALLGTANLQAYSIKVNQGGQFRGQAVLLGMDFLERVEANNEAAIAGVYAARLPLDVNAPDCVSAACTAADLALYDLTQLQAQLERQLPDASAEITFDGTGPYTYTVRISWRERASRPGTGDAAGETFSYTVSRTIYDRGVVL